MRNLKDQLLLELKRDKKRAAALLVLAVVGAIVFGRLLLKKSRPSTAEAASTVRATSEGAASEPPWESTGREHKADDYITRLDATIRRDIFAPPERYFPLPEAPKKPPKAVSSKQDLQKENAWKDAASMTLESTILSRTPKAIIDGQLVEIGDVLKGFRVVRISSRSVTLQRDRVRVILEMKGEP